VRPVFYFDLGSPYAYLAAERINSVLPEVPVWQPILLGGLFKIHARAEGMAEVERRAAEYGLPPIHWPEPWPGNTLLAMRAATFAMQAGKAVSFALAAFRQAFAAGRDLSDPDSVVIAAAACEMHPAAVLKAAETRGVADALARATAAAGEAGVRGVPAVGVGNRVFHGLAELEAAAAAVREARAA
jgi:2-hydroxychromene-2-carboxylate isomerase